MQNQTAEIALLTPQASVSARRPDGREEATAAGAWQRQPAPCPP